MAIGIVLYGDWSTKSDSSSVSNPNDNAFKLWAGLVNAVLLRGVMRVWLNWVSPKWPTWLKALMCCTFKGHYQVQRGRLSFGGLTEELETSRPNGCKDHVILQHIKVLTSRLHAVNWVSPKWRPRQKARFLALSRVNLEEQWRRYYPITKTASLNQLLPTPCNCDTYFIKAYNVFNKLDNAK